MSEPRLSQIERAERAIAEFLKGQVATDVRVDVQPDDPQSWDMGGADRAILVHFAQSVPSRKAPAVKLAGRTTFAVICLARSLRGATSGYRLLEDVEIAMAGADIPGCRECVVLRSALEGQAGGLWRWVVEVETEIVRGRPAPSPAAPVVSGFQRAAP